MFTNFAAKRIIDALNDVQMNDLTKYCEKCMWTAKDQWNSENYNCETHTPKCGGKQMYNVIVTTVYHRVQ